MPKEFTVSLSPISNDDLNPVVLSGDAWPQFYRITKIVGQGVTITAPSTCPVTGHRSYQIGAIISKAQAYTLGPAIKVSVTEQLASGFMGSAEFAE